MGPKPSTSSAHTHLNSQRNSIEFTMEVENEGTLPFLDVLVKRCGQQLTTTVHRKPTHTDRYLNYGSNHHPRIKSGIVKCLAHRAREVCQPDLVRTELNHLQQVFESNDYPPALVRRCLKKQRTRNQTLNETVEEEPRICCLPYIRGLSESLERACHHLNVKLVFKSTRTLRSLLTKVKSRTVREKIKGVIYIVKCSCGDTYVGETGRTLDVRLKKHKRAVKMDNQNNGIAVHANKTLHDIQWDSAEVLERKSNLYKRKFKEALHIKDENLPMNLDQGFQINPIWSTLQIT